MACKGRFIKIHRLSHVMGVMKPCGALHDSSSQASENYHTSIKLRYRRTTKRGRVGEASAQLTARGLVWRAVDAAQTAELMCHPAKEEEATRMASNTTHQCEVDAALVQHGVVVEGSREVMDPAGLPPTHALALALAVCPLLRLLPGALTSFTHQDLGYDRHDESSMAIKVIITVVVAAPVSTDLRQSLCFCNTAPRLPCAVVRISSCCFPSIVFRLLVNYLPLQ
jgi:hypothetical protein